MQRLVDTHVHVWDRRRLKLPWLEQVPALDRDWTPAEWKDALPDGDVVRGVYMEVDADEGDQGRELDLIAELMSDPRAGLVAAVAPGDPSVADLDDRIEFCAGIPRIRGFRSVLHTERSPRHLPRPAFLRGVSPQRRRPALRALHARQ